jgi:hypothetical protein
MRVESSRLGLAGSEIRLNLMLPLRHCLAASKGKLFRGQLMGRRVFRDAWKVGPFERIAGT